VPAGAKVFLIADGALHHGRSAVLASYALCGFSHVASVAIFVGGIAALAPGQTRTLLQVASRALVAATLACLMTAAVAGTFYGCGALLFTLP
jgi:concentrative nucleoside transporter, CNT family